MMTRQSAVSIAIQMFYGSILLIDMQPDIKSSLCWFAGAVEVLRRLNWKFYRKVVNHFTYKHHGRVFFSY